MPTANNEVTTTRIRLGAASSYAIYREHTTDDSPMTEAEWIEHIARVSENAQSAHADAQAAKASAEAAEAAKTDAVSEGEKAVSAINNAGEAQVQAVTTEGGTQVERVNTAGTGHVTAINQAGQTQTGNVNSAGSTQVQAVNDAGAAQVQAVESAGTEAKDLVTAEGEKQIERVANQGTTSTQAVNDAGSTQVQAVTAEGTTQVGRVETRGQEIVDSLPEDYTEIQTEVSDLKSAIDAYLDDLTPIKFVNGSYIKTSDGAFASDPNYTRTDYIDISGYERIIYHGTKVSSYNAFYDTNKSFISPAVVTVASDSYLTIPDGAVYIAFSNTTADMLNFTLVGKRKTNGTSLSDAIDMISKEKANQYPFTLMGMQYVRASDGAILKDGAYSRTEYIDISGFAALNVDSIANSNYNAFYDASKNFISAFSVTAGSNHIDIPANAKYAVLSGTNASMNAIKIASYLDQYIYKVESGADIDVSDLVEESQNLFDKNAAGITDGYTIGSNGALVSSTGSSITDYIPVIPGNVYSQYYVAHTWTIDSSGDMPEITDMVNTISYDRNYVAFYDYNKTLIGASNTEPYQNPRVPNNCRFIRCAYTSANVDNFMVIPGHVTPGILYASYEPSTAFDGVEVKIKRFDKFDSSHSSHIKGISRLGYNVTGYDTPPQQTIPAFDLACEHNFQYLLADVAFTADNVAVCFHDKYIGASYPDIPLYNDGSQIENSDHSVTIASYTYDYWNQNFDFGLYKGEAYRGTKLLTVDEFIRYCKLKGKHAYLEVKVSLTSDQTSILANILKKYDMQEYTMVVADTSLLNITALGQLETLCPKLKRIAFMPETLTDNAKAAFSSVEKDGVEVVWFGWGNYILTQDVVDYLTEHHITYETGTFENESAMRKWMTLGCNWYCTGIESGRIEAGRAMYDFASDSLG